MFQGRVGAASGLPRALAVGVRPRRRYDGDPWSPDLTRPQKESIDLIPPWRNFGTENGRFKSLDCVLERNKKAVRIGRCGNRSPTWSNRKSPRPSLMKPHVSIEQIEATGRKLQYLVVPPESDCEYLHLWGKFLMSTKAPAIQRTQSRQWMSSGSNVSWKLGSR